MNRDKRKRYTCKECGYKERSVRAGKIKFCPQCGVKMREYRLFIDGKERVAQVGENGYMYFWLTDGSGVKAHRAIMEHYLGRKLRKDEHVHHKDGDRTNNDLSNLVVLSHGEHSKLHRLEEVRAGKVLFGGDNEKRKRKVKGVNKQGDILEYNSLAEARAHGFSHVVDCCQGKRKTDKGYVWRYSDER